MLLGPRTLRWFQMGLQFREKKVGTRETSPVHATYGHVTTRVIFDKVKKVYPNIEDNTRLTPMVRRVLL